MKADLTTWAYKDGARAALAGEPRDSNPCDPAKEALRREQWFAGYDAGHERGDTASPFELFADGVQALAEQHNIGVEGGRLYEATAEDHQHPYFCTDDGRLVRGRPPAGPAAPALDELTVALGQYRDDLMFPPADDSRERRLAMVRGLLARLGGVA